jgi:hypothetical protein
VRPVEHEKFLFAQNLHRPSDQSRTGRGNAPRTVAYKTTISSNISTW